MGSARPRWPSSLRARITLWYSVLLGLPLVAFALVCYVVVARTLERRTDGFIGDALTAFSRELVAERRASLSVGDAMSSTAREVRFHDLHIAILDSAGRVLAMSAAGDPDAPSADGLSAASAERIHEALRRLDIGRPLVTLVSTPDAAYRVVSRPITDDGVRYALTGAYPMDDIESVLARIREMFLIAIPLLVLTAATGGYFLAKRSLAPVASMAAHAAHIGASNLHERLPVEGGDELVGLARIVNGLLDRLQQSFEQQRRFVADASHELRTPTAIVRTEADVTLSKPHRDEDDYRASTGIIQDAARRLTRIVDDLFLLARADSSQLVAQRAPVDLDELLHDVTRGLRILADARDVHIELRMLGEAPYVGDADMLGRVMLNLLDNAVKHSVPGGVVTAELTRVNGRYLLDVIDGGPGIPDGVREKVFDRFFRADSSRSRAESSATSGAGLGLSIARHIAELHGGTLELVETRPGRTVFRLALSAR